MNDDAPIEPGEECAFVYGAEAFAVIPRRLRVCLKCQRLDSQSLADLEALLRGGRVLPTHAELVICGACAEGQPGTSVSAVLWEQDFETGRWRCRLCKAETPTRLPPRHLGTVP